MPYATSDDGCRLYYQVSGRGDQTLVLVPGLGGNGNFWNGVSSYLEDRFQIVVVDHRGAGRSDRPLAGPYTIDRIARDVLAVLDDRKVSRASFIGHSTGGAIVQTLAIDYPQRVARIVISGSWEKPDARFRALFEARRALLDHGLAADYQKLTHVLGFTPTYMASHAAELAAVVEAAATVMAPLPVTAARVGMLLDFDRSADLHRISAPTLVLSATDDEMVPVHHGLAIAAAIPDAAFQTCQGGHFFPRVDPQTYAEAVLPHIAGGQAF